MGGQPSGINTQPWIKHHAVRDVNAITQSGTGLHPRTAPQYAATSHASVHAQVTKVLHLSVVVYYRAGVDDGAQAQLRLGAYHGTRHDDCCAAHRG